MKLYIYIFLFFSRCILANECELKIAVSSNFFPVLKTFITEFENKHKCKVLLMSDSSSNLYSKIINGANFDAFITADKRHYYLLSKLFNDVSSMLTFVGRLSIFIRKDKLKKNLLINLSFYKKISFANKNLAPYGYAAFEFINNLKIFYNDFVFGNNINQVFVFVNSYNSDLGFVSLSQNIIFKTHLNHYRKIPTYLYSVIKQDMIIFKYTYLISCMENFIKDISIRNIIINNGYKILE